MKIKDYQDGKLITLNRLFDDRSKILYVFYFGSFFFAGSIFLWVFFNEKMDGGGILLIGIIVAAFYIAAFRFLNKILMTEKIFVNEKELRLIKKGFLNSEQTSFEISKISNFRHLEKPELPRHPLAGQTFDYLGFQTEQQVINEMHGDNRLAFDYNGKTIFFGQNVYSWDFEELDTLFYQITKNDLRYDDETEKLKSE